MRATVRVNSIVRTVAIIVLISAAAVSTARAQRVLGLDVSAWQGNLSTTTWATFKRPTNQQVSGVFGDGRDFVFIRSSRGGTTGFYNQSDADNSDGLNTFSQRYDDPYFVQNINRATSAGMFAGSYHFARADIVASTLNSGGIPNSGIDEANHFIQMAGPWMRPGYLLPVLDLEAGSNRSTSELSSFATDFADQIFAFAGVRPLIYANSSYVNDEVNSSVATSMPHLWIARPSSGDPLTTEPPAAPGYPNVYGRWNPTYPTIPTPQPWKFWQYDTTGGLNGYSGNLDKNAANGGMEFLKDFLVPALWMNDSSGGWTDTWGDATPGKNWNSGQAPVAPVTGPGQVTPVGTQTLPSKRLPGSNDTVILDRSSANITVTLSSGTQTIRKLYMRETLNITGGTLNINYDPTIDAASTPISAQFSGGVTLSGTGGLSVNTLQVDATRTFTLAGSTGTLTFKQINLMPHATTPAKLSVTGNVNVSPLSNGTATVSNGSGTGSTGLIDLGGGARTFNVGHGSASVDLDVAVPITNGSLVKSGAGTMQLSGSNTFSALTIGAGVMRTNHASALTNTMAVTVNNGGTLDLNGITETIASLESANGNITGSVLQGAASLSLSASSGTYAYAGTITGTGTLTKNSGSTQFLNGNNSLGPIAVFAGKLLLNGSNTTGNITVSTNGVLGGSGSVSGAVTLNNLGHLAPGASIESFDVGALTLNSGSILDFELGAGGIMDQLNVTGLLTIVGSTVNLVDTGGMSTGLYTLIDYGTISGSVSGLGTPNGPSTFKYSLIDTGSAINLRVSILGDFNFDDKVDAADYVVWRKGLGTTYSQADYSLWRAHYGETAGSGMNLDAGGAVPEPGAIAMVLVAALPLFAGRRRAQ